MARKPQTTDDMLYGDEPSQSGMATQKQIDFIRSLGGSTPKSMTVEQASAKLNRLTAKIPMSASQEARIEDAGGIVDCDLSYAEASEFIDFLETCDRLPKDERRTSNWAGATNTGIPLALLLLIALITVLVGGWLIQFACGFLD